ncbi:DUF4352 domain-containing protein [Halostagnicola sp. A-GB9-2]|uniref:DUF4352 domain-containing protein n=1 Tax=Halostagnicola sp. A-GB9-2 TaxID=3048066 RepID=UPI0024C06041|nr:DUF4352 domain-containing protein [Halostagnicola sp. A-GB9-2]MDJ1433176.1 DUF4352 domain-containing protein [Halostagnicola sp. A-GB9-2]
MDRIDRRTYLSLVVGGTLVLAGCAGDENDGSESEPATENPSVEEDEPSASTSETEPTDESADSDEPTTVEIGELLEADDLRLVVYALDRVDDVGMGSSGPSSGPNAGVAGSNARVARSENELLEASDGTTFAVVDLALQYVGDEPVATVDDRLTIELADETGERHEHVRVPEREATGTGEEPSDGGEGTAFVDDLRLAPGEVARGNLLYEVDEDAEELVLDLEIGEETEEYVLDLESEADSPETIEQDLTGDVLSFSQGVETADLEVAVTGLEHGNNLGGFMQSDEGYEIVAVGVTFENESGREYTLSSEQAQLKDESGYSYEQAAGVVRALEGFDDDVLEDAEESDRKVAYQIEEGISELYWVFDFGEGGADRRAFWKLR